MRRPKKRPRGRRAQRTSRCRLQACLQIPCSLASMSLSATTKLLNKAKMKMPLGKGRQQLACHQLGQGTAENILWDAGWVLRSKCSFYWIAPGSGMVCATCIVAEASCKTHVRGSTSPSEISQGLRSQTRRSESCKLRENSKQ